MNADGEVPVQLGRGDLTLPESWVLAHREASFFGVQMSCLSLFHHLLTPYWWGLSLGL